MKKLISVLLSITLAVLCFSSLAVSADPTKIAQDNRSYVIWEANPLNLSNKSLFERGGMINDVEWGISQDSNNSAQIKSDINGAYYEVTLGQNGGYGAVFASSIIGNTYDFTGWLADQAFVNTIMPYLTVKCDLRRVDSGVVKPGFDIGLIPLWSNQTNIAFVKANSEENSQVNASRGEWISCEGSRHGADKIFGGHLADGLFYVSAWGEGDDAVLADTPVVIDVRNLRIEVKESDRLAFNKALNDAGYTRNGSSGWNNISFGQDEESNTDYFGAVIKYNDIAEYTTEKKRVIYDANPINVSATDGASAKPSWACDSTDHSWTFGYKTNALGVVKYDEDIPYYELKITSEWSSGGAVIENGFTSNKENFGWLTSRSVLTALKDYLEVSYDVFISASDGKDTTLYVNPICEWDDKSPEDIRDSFRDRLDEFTVSANQWITRTAEVSSFWTGADAPHWGCGDLLFNIAHDGVSETNPVTVKIRNFRITLKENDKAVINQALSAIDGIDNIKWFTTDWEGNANLNNPTDGNGRTDYFALLCNYDSVSNYSTSFTAGDLNSDGSTDILDLVRFKKYAADSTVGVNYAARDCDGNNLYSSASDLAALRKILLGCTL